MPESLLPQYKTR